MPFTAFFWLAKILFSALASLFIYPFDGVSMSLVEQPKFIVSMLVKFDFELSALGAVI